MAKIATVLANLFEDSEYTQPKKALEAAEHDVVTIGVKAGETVQGVKDGTEVTIEKAIDEVKAEEFDALFIPGGYSPDQLRADERMLDFVRHFDNDNKWIFTICHGPQLLVNAETLKGKDITAVKQVAIDVKNAGANFYDKEVVIDEAGKLISSRTPEDLPAFDQAIVAALK